MRVIVAGDVFDTGAPPSYAREQYNRFIVALRDTGAQLVVLGGNHDSVATLGESRTLLACLDTCVIPAVSEDLEEQLQVLCRRDGSPGAILCGVPFVRPRDVLRSEAGQSAEDKQQSPAEPPFTRITRHCTRWPRRNATPWAAACRSSPPAT